MVSKKKKKKVFTEIETDFPAEIQNSKVFSAQHKVVSKKKEKKKNRKRSSPKLRLIFRPKSKIQRFFPPKIRWSPKKKKKTRSSPKLRLIFRPKSKIQRFFPPKIRWSPKKEKKNKVFTEIETDFPAEIQNSKVFSAQNKVVSKKKENKVFTEIETDFPAEIQNSKVFSAQNQVVSKKRKKKRGLHRNWDWFFGQIRKFKRLRGAVFLWGGAIFNFSQKIGLKSSKNVRFCILHKPMGGTRAPPPPPPGYATG